MKKCLMILIVFMLVSCTPTKKLSIMVPQGSPAMTILGLDQDDYAIDIVNGPDPLVAAFGSGSHNAIIAPTNLGVKLYQSKPDYRLAAVVVFGNYHLVSTTFNQSDLNEIEGKTIIVFGQNQTSDIIIKHLIEQKNITVSINYVDSVQLASAEYLSDPTQIVMVAEPSLSKLKVLVPETKSIDLQEVYAQLHEDLSYPQASLFVQSTLSNQDVNQLIDDLKKSIEQVNDGVETVIMRGIELGISDNFDTLENAILGSHLDLLTPDLSMNSIETYLNVILDLNPMLIGGKLPDSSIYWSDEL